MVVDRVERHDVVNAVMLAGVLLLLGFGIVTAFQSLFDTLDDGVVSARRRCLESESRGARHAATIAGREPTTTLVPPARPTR